MPETTFPSTLPNSNTAKQYFLKLLMQQIQDSVVFEGPDGSKNLALDSQGMNHIFKIITAVKTTVFLKFAVFNHHSKSVHDRLTFKLPEHTTDASVH